MTALLEMRNITKTFPGVKALDNVTPSVRKGEIHAICGENGAGKSTLMKVLSGVYPHGSYDGQIIYDGQPASFAGIRDSEDRGIIIIHQELALGPLLTIAENIFLGNERATRGVIDWPMTFRQTETLLAKVGLRETPGTRVDSLGVGKQQLVEIAKAEREGADAIVIACFDDTGLDAARALAAIPVIGICEAALHCSDPISKVFSESCLYQRLPIGDRLNKRLDGNHDPGI